MRYLKSHFQQCTQATVFATIIALLIPNLAVADREVHINECETELIFPMSLLISPTNYEIPVPKPIESPKYDELRGWFQKYHDKTETPPQEPEKPEVPPEQPTPEN